MPLIDLDARRAYHREYTRKWRTENPEKLRGYEKAWRERNPDKQAAKARRQKYRRVYGITIAEYDQMFSAQGGVCAICQQPGKKKRLAVDHNHQTGQVRALLCDRCNTDVGILESPMLAAYQNYLARFE